MSRLHKDRNQAACSQSCLSTKHNSLQVTDLHPVLWIKWNLFYLMHTSSWAWWHCCNEFTVLSIMWCAYCLHKNQSGWHIPWISLLKKCSLGAEKKVGGIFYSEIFATWMSECSKSSNKELDSIITQSFQFSVGRQSLPRAKTQKFLI